MKVSIIGLGLIGGSFGLALKSIGEVHITGWDQNPANLRKALELGLIDQKAHSVEECFSESDWIFLAIPVDAIETLLPGFLDRLREDQWVVDFGSTKEAICQTVEDHNLRRQFLAAHPIAGTEYSGPESAFSSLFQDKTMIICESEKTSDSLVEAFSSLCRSLSMKLSYLSARDHDKHLAYVSHLSHVIAFGLSNAVLSEEKEDNRILDLAGSGFDSTVRLAKSSPEMWTPIFIKNRRFLLEAIDNFMKETGKIRDFLSREESEEIFKFLQNGREIRKILK